MVSTHDPIKPPRSCRQSAIVTNGKPSHIVGRDPHVGDRTQEPERIYQALVAHPPIKVLSPKLFVAAFDPHADVSAARFAHHIHDIGCYRLCPEHAAIRHTQLIVNPSKQLGNIGTVEQNHLIPEIRQLNRVMGTKIAQLFQHYIYLLGPKE